MQKFLFARVEVWVLALICIFFAIGAFSFGAVVLMTERGVQRFGSLGRAAVEVAAVPLTVKELLGPDRRVYPQGARFDGVPSGWSFAADAPPAGLTGYILLSRVDGDLGRPVVELVNLADFTTKHQWTVDPDRLLDGIVNRLPYTRPENWTVPYFQPVHPWVTDDGGMLVKDHYSPLIRMDACGNVVWQIDEMIFSHSIELAADGSFWIVGHALPRDGDRWAPSFHDDSAVRVTADGKIAESYRLRDILTENGLESLLFPAPVFSDDPIHLNDVEPVLADGPYWKAGDLFMSLRESSTVLLFRPSTGKIIWMQRGPWQKQHDVDILDDHRISVFDNNSKDFGRGSRVDGVSDVIVYDFATGETTRPWGDAFTALDLETTYEGLADQIAAGTVMTEETNAGRLQILDQSGTVLARFINRAGNGQVYRMGWSRYISKERGDKIAHALTEAQCND